MSSRSWGWRRLGRRRAGTERPHQPTLRARGIRTRRVRAARRCIAADAGRVPAREVLGPEHRAVRRRAADGHRQQYGVRHWRGLPADLDQSTRWGDPLILYLGRTSTAELSLYQPLDHAADDFLEPGITARRSVEDLFLDGQAVARYDFERAYGFLDIGRVLGTRAELRAGIVSGIQSADRDIANTALPDVPTEGYGGRTGRSSYDTRDRVDLPSQGWLGRLSYFHSDESLGSETVPAYEKLDALVAGSYHFGKSAACTGAPRAEPLSIRPCRSTTCSCSEDLSASRA